VVEPGEPALREIVAEFGPGVLRPDGTLDRPALGAIVFGDSTRRRRLEEITHPAIRERFTRRVAELVEAGFTGVALFDAAVIVESGGYKTLDGLVVVVTDEETELARLMARDQIGREDALRKIRSQMPVAEKARLADHVIDNTGDRTATEAQVRAVYAALLERRRRMSGPAP
jgi:dephospho-CoA kinase